MKKIMALLLAALLVGTLLVGCGGGVVTEEKAKEIALKEIDLKESQVDDIHVHMVTEKGLPCYSVHITAGDREVSVLIDIASGDILS